MLPLWLIAGGAALGLNYLRTKDASTVEAAKADMAAAFDQLGIAADRAKANGKLTDDMALSENILALKNEHDAVLAIDPGFFAASDYAAIVARATKVIDLSKEYDAQLSALTGEPLNVTGRSGSTWGIGDWALLAGGAYVAYRLLFGSKPLVELFSSGSEYPKSKLPRYAGGRRRLTA